MGLRELCPLPEPKVNLFWIISLAYAKSYSKTFLDIKFLFVNRFSNFIRTLGPLVSFSYNLVLVI